MNPNDIYEKKAYELGIDEEVQAKHGLVGVRRVGNLLWTSGSGCADFRQGKVGDELTFEDGYAACEHIALIQLGIIKEYLGDLSRVEQVLRVYGHVTVADDFHDLDAMADGFSNVFGTVLGEKGRSPRTILGSRNLPVGNTAAELEVLLVIRD